MIIFVLFARIQTTPPPLPFIRREAARLFVHALEIRPKPVDCGVQSCRTVIHNLRTTNRLLSPISTLPPEVLCQIFFSLASEKNPMPNVKATSHVSHRWREAALADAKLWAVAIDIRRGVPLWTAEMLKRSSSIPLSVVANFIRFRRRGRRKRATQNLLLVLEDLSRIQELDVRAQPNVFDSFSSRLSSPAPLLVSLTLRCDTRSQEDAYHLPHALFDSHAPVLRSLNLKNCAALLDSSIYFGLTHLEVDMGDVSDSAKPSMMALLSALEGMPRLQKLYLRDVISAVSLSRSVVHFTDLAYLELVDEADHCVSFINTLSFPPDISIMLSCVGRGTDADSAIMATMGSRLEGILLHTMTITTGQRHILIEGWDTKSDSIDIPPSRKIQLKVLWNLPAKLDDIICQLTPSLGKALSLARVETLTIQDEGCVKLSNAVWPGLLRGFGRVKSLQLMGRALYNLLPATLEDIDAKIGTQRALLPLMENLLIQNVNFMKIIGSRTEFGADLLQLLKRRRALQAELQVLEITECTNVQPWLFKLEKNVASVICRELRRNLYRTDSDCKK